jgi:hypothetical protein
MQRSDFIGPVERVDCKAGFVAAPTHFAVRLGIRNGHSSRLEGYRVEK